GGVSVGDYDFVPEAIRQAGLKTVFHKVRQKPAKPLLFATGSGKRVIGLPGNPGSVITSFHALIKPMLDSLCGLNVHPAQRMPSGFSYSKKPGLTHVMKARIVGGQVVLMGHQESYKVCGYAQLQGFALIEEQTEVLRPGDPVRFISSTSFNQ
ncbi:MAG: molybdopterin-binding protein, partial [Bacteroidota bacterium]